MTKSVGELNTWQRWKAIKSSIPDLLVTFGLFKVVFELLGIQMNEDPSIQVENQNELQILKAIAYWSFLNNLISIGFKYHSWS